MFPIKWQEHDDSRNLRKRLFVVDVSKTYEWGLEVYEGKDDYPYEVVLVLLSLDTLLVADVNETDRGFYELVNIHREPV